MAKPARAEMAAMRRAKSAQRTALFKAAAIQLVGDEQLKMALQNLADKQTRAAVNKGLTVCVREFAKGIKDQIPTNLKVLKRLVGSGLTKAKRKKQGAKAGFAVGPAAKRKDPRRSGKNVTKAGKLKGVGLGARNIMWAAIGTKKRTVKKTRMYVGQRLQDVTNWNTGKMPPIVGRAVEFGVERRRQSGVNAMQAAIWEGLIKDLTKRKAT
jgi:hypothetical protein